MILSLFLSFSFTGCADAIAEGLVRGGTEIAMEAGIRQSLTPEEELQKKPLINTTKMKVDMWKVQKFFGYGPLAEAEKNVYCDEEKFKDDERCIALLKEKEEKLTAQNQE